MRTGLSWNLHGKRNQRQSEEKIYSALSELEMQDYIFRQIGALSGGQQQRIMLARALVSTCCDHTFYWNHAPANCGPLCFYGNASDLTQDAWINETGTYHYDKHKGMEITVTDIEDAELSEEEYVYPAY